MHCNANLSYCNAHLNEYSFQKTGLQPGATGMAKWPALELLCTFFSLVPFNSRQSIGIQMHMRLKAVSWINLGRLCIDSLGSGMKVYTVGQLRLQTAYGEQVSDQNGSCTN